VCLHMQLQFQNRLPKSSSFHQLLQMSNFFFEVAWGMQVGWWSTLSQIYGSPILHQRQRHPHLPSQMCGRNSDYMRKSECQSRMQPGLGAVFEDVSK
jgi:hypothetical protein